MVQKGKKICPYCGGVLKHYDKVQRTVRTKFGRSYKLFLTRSYCHDCGSVHRELPNTIMPYKQYEKEIIKGVKTGTITYETLGYEDYPCEMTMLRWIKNIEMDLFNR